MYNRCSCPMCINLLNKQLAPIPYQFRIVYPVIGNTSRTPLDNERIFISQCPIADCNNKKICNWHHYCCPQGFTQLFISDSGIIRCPCGMNSEFFNTAFDCGLHEGETESLRFKVPKQLKRVLTVIGALEDDGIFSPDFVDKLANALTSQFRRYKNNF